MTPLRRTASLSLWAGACMRLLSSPQVQLLDPVGAVVVWLYGSVCNIRNVDPGLVRAPILGIPAIYSKSRASLNQWST